MRLTGSELIHEVGKRIIARYLEREGAGGIELTPAMRVTATGIDIRRIQGSTSVSSKVKVDCYCGTDPAKIADRDMPFYRKDASSYALEATGNAGTRAPGWMESSMADELLYYRIAIGRPEAEIAALFESPDGVFFSELGVECDDLRVLPMRELREWFARSADRYMSRPVISPEGPSWFRIIPMTDLDAAVPGVRVVGPIFSRLASR